MQKKESTTELYQERVNRVIDYVYTHIGEDISLNKLADVSGFSMYHIHRLDVARDRTLDRRDCLGGRV